MKPKLTFVTSNEMKLRELHAILGPNFPIEIVSYDLDLPELQGDIEDIIIKKCQEAARRLRIPVLVEDTCLCFNALGGLPGPYIKWFVNILRPEGLVRLLVGWEDKSAEAISTFGFCKCDCVDDLKVELFQGRAQGTIVNPKNLEYHSCDSCWDCVFQPNGYNKTYAELKEEKNRISQRYKALMKLKAHFTQMNL